MRQERYAAAFLVLGGIRRDCTAPEQKGYALEYLLLAGVLGLAFGASATWWARGRKAG